MIDVKSEKINWAWILMGWIFQRYLEFLQLKAKIICPAVVKAKLWKQIWLQEGKVCAIHM